ncbi:MAG: hypothetical protein JWP73_399 [Phenylobacterium sp.]|nr:hypothetical protein [Phenylobacterium sp.]
MRHVGHLAVLALCSALALPAAAAEPDSRTSLLTRARASYYSLAREGFAGARCRVIPDWAPLLGPLASQPQGQRAIAILETLQVSVAINAMGQATVTTKDPEPTRDPAVAAGIKQVFSGMNQALPGFFDSWSAFMINPPVPGPQTPMQITPLAGGRRLAYKDGAANVLMDIDPAGQVTRLNVTAAEFVSSMLPTFEHAPRGLTLSRYVADYEATGGDAASKVHLAVDIAYQTVNGLRIPGVLKLTGVYGGQAFNMKLTFADCQADRK